MAIANPTKDSSEHVQFKQLLQEAVTKPGTLMQAYSLFWNYSLGNQILTVIQANNRGMPLGPIASFNRWKELGRHVKRGEKAIELCMPVTCKRTVTEQAEDGNEAETQITFKRFVFKRNWFMLLQTDGAEYVPPAVPGWDRARALRTLGAEEIAFEMMNGTCQGYAKGRQIAINPLAQHKEKTTFHELAHIELGHTSEAVPIPNHSRAAFAKLKRKRWRSCAWNRSASKGQSTAAGTFSSGWQVQRFRSAVPSASLRWPTRS